MATTQQKGLVLTLLSAAIAIFAALLNVHLTATQQGAIYPAAALVVAVAFAAFHISAGQAAAGLPAVDFHRPAFWLGLAGALVTVAVVVFGLRLSSSQQHLLLAAVALVVNMVFGAAKVAAAKASAAPAAPTVPKTSSA